MGSELKSTGEISQAGLSAVTAPFREESPIQRQLKRQYSGFLGKKVEKAEVFFTLMPKSAKTQYQSVLVQKCPFSAVQNVQGKL